MNQLAPINCCGKAVGKLGKRGQPALGLGGNNRFDTFPQPFHLFSTTRRHLFNSPTRSHSTFPQRLLLQLYILRESSLYMGTLSQTEATQ